METIDYIIEQIYVHNKLPKLCKKLIFKRLLLKLTTENTFIFQKRFYKQTDGCTMGGPLSVILSDIFMTKLENKVVKPSKPKLYKRFVDDVFTKRKSNQPDQLLQSLNMFHENIHFTTESKPEKFLDTKIIYNQDEAISTELYRKPNKLPIHWKSKVPKRYKRNAINGELYRASKISSDFNKEVVNTKSKYVQAGFPIRFINSVVNQFQQKQNDVEIEEEEFIIPPFLFEEAKPMIWIEIPFCEENEKVSKRFLNKFHDFTQNRFKVLIKWITKKVKNLFKVKDPNPYPSCVIYEGICSCGADYVGETVRNALTRWSEHNNPIKDFEPAKHILNNLNHTFQWKVIMKAPSHLRTRQNLEAAIIATKRPKLNDRVESQKLLLFRNGVT